MELPADEAWFLCRASCRQQSFAILFSFTKVQHDAHSDNIVFPNKSLLEND